MTLRLASGAEVSRVILGTSRLGSVFPDTLTPSSVERSAFRVLDGAFGAGCNALDIAASYQIGGTERVIGAWMESRKNRRDLYLISKGAHPLPIVAPNRLSPKAITDDLHASLRRLRTDHLDLYLLHRDHPDASLPLLARTLGEHQRSGKILAWGVSNWTHPRIAELNRIASDAGLPTVAASSPQFSLAEWERPPWKGCVSIAGEDNREARDFYARTQLPVLAYSPLGRGFFSSRGDGARRDPIYGSPANLARRQRADTLARKLGATRAEVALAYLLSQPFPVYAIVAVTSAEHMSQSLAAARLHLEANELRRLESGEELARRG
jgi:aryl-alcohol dehydrogenase-like predicted oxidoreductase